MQQALDGSRGEANRADYYIFAVWFLLLSFFRVISAVADWMSAILPHMVWP